MAMNLWGIIKGLLVQDETDRSKALVVTVDPSTTTGTTTTLKSASTANRTLALPDTSGTLVEKTVTDGLNTRLTTAEGNISTAQTNITALQNRATTDETNLSNEITRATTAENNEVTRATNAENTIATNLTNHISQSSGAHAASAISNTPSSNVTSTNVQAAINELQTHIDVLAPGGGANATLSNLSSPTSVNQDLISDTNNTRRLGSAAKTWLEVWALRDQFLNTDGSGMTVGTTGGSVMGMKLDGINGEQLILESASNASASYASHDVFLRTGSKTAGTTVGTGQLNLASGSTLHGTTGDILLQIGTTPDTRGKIRLLDGSEGTIGHVWTSTDVNGRGHWAAPPTYTLPNNSATGASIEWSAAVAGAQVSVPNGTVTITSTGRPLLITLIPDPGNALPNSPSQIGASNGSTNVCFVTFNCFRNATTNVGSLGLQISGPSSSTGIAHAIPSSAFHLYDPAPPVGSNTYTLTANGRLGTHTAFINASRLYVREL